ncbi:hypothetical protein DAPPUDRAFT_233596 [Daphnia pulex]|uniref:Uncharacterized protein n=1 Tax=Daphnia pulex TaxID=6669 RepID=E9FV77_DAPPU|nr:hypothetical protein DAPPUDRAFT_233596 [Daphnia pulex]|eukprot:EFX89156.1 hypothetical protein DAPPUDRAFT_233596 [Daphnia pulex]
MAMSTDYDELGTFFSPKFTFDFSPGKCCREKETDRSCHLSVGDQVETKSGTSLRSRAGPT